MRKIGYLLFLLLFCACSNDNEPEVNPDEPVVEIPQDETMPLVDKADSAFLDKGRYVAVKRDFTSEELLQYLKNKVWADDDYYYAYDTYKIRTTNVHYKDYTPSYYLFLKDNALKYSGSLYDLYDSRDFEYAYNPETKVLSCYKTVQSESDEIDTDLHDDYTVIGYNADSLILDRDYESVYDPANKPELDSTTMKLRYVWRLWKILN